MGPGEIFECLICGAAYARSVPAPDELRKTYELLYGENGVYHDHRNEVDTIRKALDGQKALKVGWERRRFFSQLCPQPGDALLDVGCGTGLFISAAKMQGWKVAGVELSRDAAELGATAHKLPVQVGPIEEVSFNTEQFAAVTAWEVVEHLPCPRAFLRKVMSLLLPGGVFAGSIPNYARPRYRYGENLGPASVPPVHLNFWTPESFERTLRTAGFSQVEIAVPRFCWDLLRPLRFRNRTGIMRFLKVTFGFDTPTTMFFLAKK